MSLGDDLKAEVTKVFGETWEQRQGRLVPDADSLKLANDAVVLDATVLYADLSGSTRLVDGTAPWFAAEVYKTFLHCAAKIIRYEGGDITAYDGDRIMGVFTGDQKNASAVKAALKINHSLINIINPAMHKQYKTNYDVRATVGVDTSPLFVAKTGVRGANDLVWVGRAANYAAKLTELSNETPVWITGEVFDDLPANLLRGPERQSIWVAKRWTQMGNIRVYCSTWTWRL